MVRPERGAGAALARTKLGARSPGCPAMPGWHSCFQLDPASQQGKAECYGIGESWLLPLPPSFPRGAQGCGSTPASTAASPDGSVRAGTAMPAEPGASSYPGPSLPVPWKASGIGRRAASPPREAAEEQQRSPLARAPRPHLREPSRKEPGFPSSPSWRGGRESEREANIWGLDHMLKLCLVLQS